MSKPSYTPDQLADSTLTLVELAMAQGHHDLALSALLSAYVSIAASHPCCTQACANNCMQVSMFLAKRANEQRAGMSGQQSNHVH